MMPDNLRHAILGLTVPIIVRMLRGMPY